MEISTLAEHPEEIPKITKWYFDEWSHTAPDITFEMVQEKVTEKSINQTRIPMSFVAYLDGELAGVLELKLHENKNYLEYENWIGGVFTNPDKRGQGVATQLINKAKAFAIDTGMPQLYLQCESFNLELYLKLGFKPLHSARHHQVETTIMVWHTATQ